MSNPLDDDDEEEEEELIFFFIKMNRLVSDAVNFRGDETNEDLRCWIH